ncbi:M81 family metallopeptidase [Achromobacter sp. NPDC058515]|uniref:M81 family metallopeptidase n=1 Tax=Achromobacter sp. NPDC058515 TaxID=3346533 RepID=UPI003664A4B7
MKLEKKIRVAVLHFMHETVTFLGNDTTLDDFIYEGSPARGEELLASDTRGYVGGFVKVAREYPDVEVTGIESPLFPKTGTGSGWITHEAFEHFVGIMLRELRAQGPFDGVYLAVHGAMAVRGIARPEAELARRVRDVIGPAAFISATFDPHANEDEAFLESADMAFSVKYFPHYDCHLQGERAARMLIRAIRGDFKPVNFQRKVPIISATVQQWTGASPWMDMIQRALVWEAREPDLFVNVLFGFPWADVPDAGMTVQALTNGNPGLARKVVDDMSEWIWRRREDLLDTTKVLSIADGVKQAKKFAAEGRKPVVLADHSDRSGYATWILEQVLEQNLSRTLIATIADEQAIQTLQEAGVQVGQHFDMAVGGRVDPSSGEPVRVAGEIVHVGEKGTGRQRYLDSVNIAFGDGNLLILSRYLVQAKELEEIGKLEADPAGFDILAIKSRVHFRRGFDDSGFAKAILLVEPDEPFLGTVRLDGLRYENLDLKNFYPYGSPEWPPAT